jgi:hypothetical protein
MIPYADALLNLAWAAVCLAAFAWFLAFERRRASGSRRALRYRAIALSLALVSLFPCVSASDDSVRLQFFGSGATVPDTPGHRPAPGSPPPDKKTLGTLVRLLETLESVQIAVSLVLSVVLCAVALALIERHRSLERFLPARAGRAPPLPA